MTLAIAANTFGHYVIGVHLRRARVDAANLEGRTVTRRYGHELSSELDPEELLNALVTAVQALDPRPSAVGVAIPGEMDGAGRCWGMVDYRGFDGVHLGEELAVRLECPVSLESEGNAAAIGERRHGHGRGHPSALTVLLDERLSAGLVLGGELHRGNSGFAAQLGHLPIRSGDDARPCDCGRRGCLDAHASLRALVDDHERRAGCRESANEVLERAARGDEHAGGAVRSLVESLGIGIALVQNVLDLDAIVLVSPRPELWPLVEAGLRQTLRDLIYGPAAAEVPIFESSLGIDAVLLGAAALAEDATSAAAAQTG